MKTVVCNQCDAQEVSLNTTIKVDGSIYCTPCFETSFPEENMLQYRMIETENDPTVCQFCNKDFDDLELKKIGVYPICADCETDVRNKTFPLWVKGFFAAVLILVCFSFAWNWKYYKAYQSVNNSFVFFGERHYDKATAEMAFAAETVPEAQDLELLHSYFKGAELLSKEKYDEAITELGHCKDVLPPDYEVDSMIIQARIGKSFDTKDYEGFLDATKQNLALYKTVENYAMVASAYSCIYADKGDETAKQECFEYLKTAKEIDSSSADMKEYYNVIAYRLDSRNIISREEFKKKFPNGWVKN